MITIRLSLPQTAAGLITGAAYMPVQVLRSEAVYNGQDNITVDVPYELADVTIVLDLTNFDYATKTGATFTITVTEKTPETGLTVNAASNLFPEDSYTEHAI